MRALILVGEDGGVGRQRQWRLPEGSGCLCGHVWERREKNSINKKKLGLCGEW